MSQGQDFEEVSVSHLPVELRTELWEFIAAVLKQRSSHVTVGEVRHHGVVTLSYQPDWPASAYINIFEDANWFPMTMVGCLTALELSSSSLRVHRRLAAAS